MNNWTDNLNQLRIKKLKALIDKKLEVAKNKLSSVSFKPDNDIYKFLKLILIVDPNKRLKPIKLL